MARQLRHGQLSIAAGDSPFQLTEIAGDEDPKATEAQKENGRQVVAVVKAYLEAAKELLAGKYAHLKHLAPVHLADPGSFLAVCCLDGIVVRYERKRDKPLLACAFIQKELAECVPALSQNVIHCYTDRKYTSTIPTTGLEVRLSKQNAAKSETQDLASFRIGIDAVIERPDRLPLPPRKPFCPLSVHNSFEFQLLGELLPGGGEVGQGQPFLTRVPLRLPVGWECIEVFPFFDVDQWKPEYAPLWAESDLLGAVVTKQLQEGQFQSLDPKAEARKQLAGLLKSFKDLLDSNPEREEVLQQFLGEHPALLCPTHIGVWPKLPLGARNTDFVFQEATEEYLLVELERSSLRLFRRDGHPSQYLNHASDQVTDWLRYVEDNLSTVQRELGLTGISSTPRSLIVIGRSGSLTPHNRRTLTTVGNRTPRTQIMTYDDVYDNATAVVENVLGPVSFLMSNPNTQIYYLPTR